MRPYRVERYDRRRSGNPRSPIRTSPIFRLVGGSPMRNSKGRWDLTIRAPGFPLAGRIFALIFCLISRRSPLIIPGRRIIPNSASITHRFGYSIVFSLTKAYFPRSSLWNFQMVGSLVRPYQCRALRGAREFGPKLAPQIIFGSRDSPGNPRATSPAENDWRRRWRVFGSRPLGRSLIPLRIRHLSRLVFFV